MTWIKNFGTLSLLASFLGPFIFLNSAFAETTPVRKPLQFVLLAFDGSELADRWEDTRAFAKDNNVKFTYFVSGVLFLGRNRPPGQTAADDAILTYQGPGHGPGKSDIGFSSYQPGNTNSNQPEIAERINEMNLALREGHELGSHLNGHFTASKWTSAQWDQEFADFNHLLFSPIYRGSLGKSSIDRSNYIQPDQFLYSIKNFTGFRTPYLSQNPKLYPVLQKYGYRYDTSKTSEPNYWPEKKAYPRLGEAGSALTPTSAIWNFPLAELPLKNAKSWQQKKTLSMDYNFYVSQQPPAHRVAPISDKANQDFLYKQMIDTYRDYFKQNYDGNRAPVSIGHHFALWNGGIYWKAMKQLASEVCKLSDVRCITYSDLADFMDTLTPAELAAYRAGNFTNEPPVLTMETGASQKGNRGVAQVGESEIEKLRERLKKAREEAAARAADAKKQAGQAIHDLQKAGQAGIDTFAQTPTGKKEIEDLEMQIRRWQKFELSAHELAQRYSRESLDWLAKVEKPAELHVKGFEKTYQQLLDEGLGHMPNPNRNCEGENEQACEQDGE